MNTKEEFLPIKYSGFYDVPLCFVVTYDEKTYVFWRGYFDEKIDDYPDSYKVFQIDASLEPNLVYDWNIDSIQKEYIREVPISKVVFDETKRGFISPVVFAILR